MQDSQPASLEIQQLGRFGSPADPASADELVVSVARDQYGRVYITTGGRGSEVLVYDARAEYHRSIGRAGEGPGEMVGVRFIAIRGDTLHAFSNGPRHTRFDMNGEVINLERVPVSPKRVFFPAEGGLLIHGALNTPAGFAFPVHHIGADGAITSFGRSDEAPVTGREPTLVAMQSPDSVWIARPLQYELELWAPNNRVIRRIQRRPPWFQWPQKRNQAFLSDLWVDTTRHHLWVVAGHLHNSTPAGPVFTTVIEVIDLRSGEAVAQHSLPGRPLHFTSNGELFRTEVDESGNVVVSVLRARVSEPQTHIGGNE